MVWYRPLAPNRNLEPKYQKAPIISIVAEIEDLTRPDVRTLVVAAQGSVDQQIRLTAQPARPDLSDAERILDVLGNPIGAKFDGRMAHRMALFPGKNAAWFQSRARVVCSMRIPSVRVERYLRRKIWTL